MGRSETSIDILAPAFAGIHEPKPLPFDPARLVGLSERLRAPGGELLLVLDMYEHAYHLDYGAAAARYVDAFMRNVDWEVVSQRLERSTAPSRGEREAGDRRNPR